MMWWGEGGYLGLLETVLTEGEFRQDRTGVGTYTLFGESLSYNLQNGFPAVTTKKLAFKPVVAELLWFLEGSNDERRLAEILYGKPREELEDKNTIWTANVNADYWLPKAKFNGDAGKIYGVNWRNFNEYDQIAELVRSLTEDPSSRRHILTAWNPPELTNATLPPCHVMCQFDVSNDKKLSCQMYQRSADLVLGSPFNVASYALLTHMLAQVCGYDVGYLTVHIGNCHIYANHIDQVNEQLTRSREQVFAEPTLELNQKVKNIFEFKMSDIKLKNYKSHPSIKAPMAV